MKRALTAAVVVALMCSTAYAAPLTLNSAGVVGTLNGITGSVAPENELIWAQHLLDMLKSDTDNTYAPLSGYATSDTEYYALLSGGVKVNEATNIVAPAYQGYQYLFAKYDGQNGGWVLFHLPTWYGATGSYNIPVSPYSIWGNEGQYGVSHYTVYNPGSVPDGGSMAMMFGAALVGLAGFRRMLK